MLGNNTGKTRRDVLKLTGGVAGTAGLTGLASAGESGRVEVNVGYASTAGRRAAASAAASVEREFGFDAMTITVDENALSGLRNRGDVRYVERNGTMHALAQSVPYGIDRVDADVAQANGTTGSGADVAIVDTGIDSDHPHLQGVLGEGRAFARCKGGPKSCRYDWDDDNDHGTHCAGTAGAIDNSEGVVGVSSQATLHAVKVLDKRGSGSYSDIAAGVEYVADQGWDVASMSLGGSSSSSVLRDAIQYADSRGVFQVAAAGNSGPCSDCVGYPAAYPEVMAVSATDSTDTLADFSSTGPEVDIAAPGVDVNSTLPGGTYGQFSGTSMSCPHVAGAAGLLIDAGYAPTEVRSRLAGTAEDIGYGSDATGAGLLDTAAALGLDSSDDL
jgi:subtilisin